MHPPAADILFGNPQLALVHPFERRLDRVAPGTLGRGRDLLAALPSGIDRGGEVGVGHQGGPAAGIGAAPSAKPSGGVNRAAMDNRPECPALNAVSLTASG